MKIKFWKPVYKILFLTAGLMGIQSSSFAITYIGDDAAEGTAITAGNSTYSLATLTYCYVASAATFTNTSGTTTNIQLSQVNFEAGASSGSLKPFVATYTGAQNTTDMANKTKYNVLVVGDAITVTSTGVKNMQFLSGGANPVIILNPGDVLVAGALTTGAGLLKYKSAVPDTLAYYLFNGNSLPGTFPNPFTGNSSFTAFTGKMNFNVGFIPAPTGVSTATTLSSPTANPTAHGSNVVFTATVSPAPTNGETVTFMDGGTAMGTGVLASGQANYTNGALAVGSHSITAVYGGDGHYFNSSSAALQRLVLYPFAGSYYIGDDAVEQTAVTVGNTTYGGASLTYAFVQASTFSTYTNTSGSTQNVQLYQVNYYSSGSGSISPYVATYTGSQTSTDVANGNNYNVLVIGDPITVPAIHGAYTVPFLASGTNPVVTLNPGDVLVSGFYETGAGVISLTSAATGLIDYLYNGNALPYPTAPGPLTANSSYSLDGTLKFNVGFVVNGSATVTAMNLNTLANPWSSGSNLTFTVTISPAPTNGEVVTFMDGANTLGTGTLASGIATYTTSSLTIGQHIIKAVYAYDGNYLACNASLLQVIAAPYAGTYYIGDDAFEGAHITVGNGSDSVSNLTYDFVQSGAGNYATYTNATASVKTIQLTQVNYFSGANTNGTVMPFVSTYIGSQTSADVANGANYNVLLVGDPITTPLTSTNSLINSPFLAGGTNPIITLNPGDVLTAGYVVSGSGAVQYQLASSGLIDYIYNGNSLPGSTPGAFAANSTYSLDRTIKFNVGFAIVRPTLALSSLGSGQFQVAWPANDLGWFLQVQTNSLATGLNGNWVTVPGSDSMTNVTVTTDPANASVFLRLVSP